MHASVFLAPSARSPEAASASQVRVGVRLATLLVLLGVPSAAPPTLAAPSVETAPVVCVSSHTEVDVKGGGKSAVINETRVYALRRLGVEADRLRVVAVFSGYEYHPAWVEATVSGARGVKLVRRLHEFLDIPAFSYGVFVSDSRALFTKLPPFEVGDTLTIVQRTRIEPFLGFPLHVMGDGAMPTLAAEYEVRVDKDLSPCYRLFSGATEPAERSKGGKILWTWRAGPLVPPESEDLGPPPEDSLPTVSVGLSRIAWGPAATWEDIAASYWGQIAAKTFEGIGESISSDRDERGLSGFERILARVQSNVRYLAIELGRGGKIPHAAADVLRRRYGDCKDMATLILAYLRAEGIQGSLVLVRTRYPSGYKVEPLPTLEYFNHAIACVGPPGGVAWLDATDPYGTALHPRSDSQGAPALVVTGPARGFHRIPLTDAAENRSGRTLRLHEDAGGNWTVDYAHALFGARAQDVIRHLEQGSDTVKVAAAHFDKVGLNLATPLSASQLTIASDRPDRVRIRCTFPIVNPTDRVAARVRLRPLWDPDPVPMNVFDSRVRQTDVYWSFLETIVDTFEVRSERLRFQAPPDTTWGGAVEGLQVFVHTEPLADGFRITRNIAFTRPVFPVARWAEGLELHRRMIRCCTSEVSATLP